MDVLCLNSCLQRAAKVITPPSLPSSPVEHCLHFSSQGYSKWIEQRNATTQVTSLFNWNLDPFSGRLLTLLLEEHVVLEAGGFEVEL